ncbi:MULTISPECIES: fimbrial protein [Klebsiella]|nr:fimbrial protein [Klebsiella oxytoca]MCW9542880.1 fimbrial protein [Klebsiella oxytoca]MCW9566545.1 fimbrial protein [Klebsiella oxytoca]MCW9577169.1 fimbrial protein [Klebsiella oxytoca]MEB6474057.1 type 1 fimbrial protein [Klebsiella oxytoca]MEB6492253.1 type 1 fimbrial protein [Klebsiella oxytoca]
MNVIAKSVAVGLLAMAAGSAWASDGTIEFTGEITTSTCEFANGDTVNVELGHYSYAQFKSVGDKSPTTQFTIPLTNCPTQPWKHANGNTNRMFQIWLETRSTGTTGDNNDLVAVTGSGTPATGVGIRIDRASDGTQLALNKLNDTPVYFDMTGEQTDVNLQAYYVSTVESSAITAGEANASVDVTIDYR